MFKFIRKLKKYRVVATVASLLSSTLNLLLYWGKLISILTAFSAGIVGWVLAWIDGHSQLVVILSALIAISLVVWGWYGWRKWQQHKLRAKRMRSVSNQVYEDKVVGVDGKRFVQCTFRNVTFQWNRSLCEFVDCHFEGKQNLLVKDPHLIEFSEFLLAVELLNKRHFGQVERT